MSKPVSDKWIEKELAYCKPLARGSQYKVRMEKALRELQRTRQAIREHRDFSNGELSERFTWDDLLNATLPEGDK